MCLVVQYYSFFQAETTASVSRESYQMECRQNLDFVSILCSTFSYSFKETKECPPAVCKWISELSLLLCTQWTAKWCLTTALAPQVGIPFFEWYNLQPLIGFLPKVVGVWFWFGAFKQSCVQGKDDQPCWYVSMLIFAWLLVQQPPKLCQFNGRPSLCKHVLHHIHHKDPNFLDIHVLDGWMPATETHPACMIPEAGMPLPA